MIIDLTLHIGIFMYPFLSKNMQMCMDLLVFSCSVNISWQKQFVNFCLHFLGSFIFLNFFHLCILYFFRKLRIFDGVFI